MIIIQDTDETDVFSRFFQGHCTKLEEYCVNRTVDLEEMKKRIQKAKRQISRIEKTVKELEGVENGNKNSGT